jgi:hypothetical protein
MMINKMALDLGLTRKFIVNFSHAASYAYKYYTIRKRNGDERPIHHPSKQLKAMQRWLLAYVIEPLSILRPPHTGSADRFWIMRGYMRPVSFCCGWIARTSFLP